MNPFQRLVSASLGRIELAPRRLAARSILGIAALGCVAGWQLAAQNGTRTTRDGVFSAQQAARGEQLFQSICTSCHDVTEFTGAGAYLDDVEGELLWETFDYISAEMPEDDPGSLPLEDYAAVLAYLFGVLGLPSGASDLPVDEASLEAIVIERPALPGS